MTPDDFQARTGVSRETLERLRIYAALLEKWQKAINLVAPNTVPELWSRHFLDSAQLLALAPPDTARWLDLGSGGGFPGLVIAAMGVPAVHLVESDQRKTAFMREAARAMGISPVFHVKRIEALDPVALHAAMGGLPQVISARALAPLAELLALAHPLAGPETVYLFPKGRQARDELTEARRYWTIENVEALPSQTDPAASILRIKGLQPA
ncbi:MAG TPA: 16S rRNA (guanine(527)-N(7))-methyltransferase RsmG [Ferrovibrio sp.]|uniref:16S rRNA (guanine(527)-N(7))-methyltransferase RsmG n=1 Tax=Ferrovibrio sp. TaxID=1917215 RepID=UPI002B4B1B94|nr:16S rRNA (guanine(527)-N(7))-methyltransferase RsmG [Ferrovibrio sp.]HLT77170.1 16S rRNA (guanine(527)-N(7))-methyltransferase RsmG [Ferrovibrio sp.]